MRRVTRWQRLLCYLGRHGVPRARQILHYRHQVCSRCGADLCRPDSAPNPPGSAGGGSDA